MVQIRSTLEVAKDSLILNIHSTISVEAIFHDTDLKYKNEMIRIIMILSSD